MSLIPKEIEEHYLRGQESERLSGARGELEQLRTQAILAQNLPRAPAEIFDVGGAGIHAFPLAKQGYQVHLIDPVELHLEQARSYVARSGVTLRSITFDRRAFERFLWRRGVSQNRGGRSRLRPASECDEPPSILHDGLLSPS